MTRPGPFNPERETYVGRPLRASGKVYQRGELFDWKAQGVHERTAQAMYQLGKLTHIKPDISVFKVAVEAPTDAPKEQTDDLDQMGQKELHAMMDELGIARRKSLDDCRAAIREALA